MPRTRPQVLQEHAQQARAIGARAARARTAAGLAQGDIARALGVAQSAIAKIERGERRLSFLEALDMAALCGVPVRDLDPRTAPAES